MAGSNEYWRSDLPQTQQPPALEQMPQFNEAFAERNLQEERFFHSDEFNREYAAELSSREFAADDAQDGDTPPERRSRKKNIRKLAQTLRTGAAAVSVAAVVVAAPLMSGGGMKRPEQGDAPHGETGKEIYHEHTAAQQWQILLQPVCGCEGEQVLLCEVCGEVMQTQAIPALEHVESEWFILSDPSCTYRGSEGTFCVLCGAAMQTVETEMGDHLPSAWIIDKDNTCRTGERHKECTVCGLELERETIAAKHTLVTLTGYPNSCTENGLTDGQVCSACGKVVTPQSVIPAAHTPVREESYPPSCEEGGYIGALYCSVCREVLEYPQQLGPLGHNWVYTGIDAAGADYYTCSNCGNITNYP